MKISIDNTIEDIENIQKQIIVLNELLTTKKQIMAKYFEKTGKNKISSNTSTIYVSERVSVKYDIKKIIKSIGKEMSKKFIDKSIIVDDSAGLSKSLKRKGIDLRELKEYIHIESSVDENKLSELYDKGELSLSALDDCYEATVKKSINLKFKK